MGACPNFCNFIATATDTTWTHDELMKNSLCHFCNRMHYNNWFSCNRRASMVNLHPGLASAARHHYYLVKLISKYVINPYTSYTAIFNGPDGRQAKLHEYQIPHVSLPKPMQIKKYVTYGMYIF